MSSVRSTSTIPACDGRTDGHSAMANVALAQRRKGKNYQRSKIYYNSQFELTTFKRVFSMRSLVHF